MLSHFTSIQRGTSLPATGTSIETALSPRLDLLFIKPIQYDAQSQIIIFAVMMMLMMMMSLSEGT